MCPATIDALAPLATDTAGQAHVLCHDRHTVGVDGAQVRLLKHTDKVGLRGFLERQDSSGLETKICHVDVLHDFMNEALEGSLADKELCALLVLADIAEGDGSGTVTMALLHYTDLRAPLVSVIAADGELRIGCGCGVKRMGTD
jgi:hypothetical protein